MWTRDDLFFFVQANIHEHGSPHLLIQLILSIIPCPNVSFLSLYRV